MVPCFSIEGEEGRKLSGFCKKKLDNFLFDNIIIFNNYLK